MAKRKIATFSTIITRFHQNRAALMPPLLHKTKKPATVPALINSKQRRGRKRWPDSADTLTHTNTLLEVKGTLNPTELR